MCAFSAPCLATCCASRPAKTLYARGRRPAGRKRSAAPRRAGRRLPPCRAEQRLSKDLCSASASCLWASFISLTRAFAFYFELTNLAETNHRKRRRTAAQISGAAAAQRGSLRGTLRAMRAAGISAEEALAQLSKVSITPVFNRSPYRDRPPLCALQNAGAWASCSSRWDRIPPGG